MVAHVGIIEPDAAHALLGGPQFVHEADGVIAPPFAILPRLVPIVDLGGDDDASDNDAKVNRDREPIVRGDMLADSADDHG